MKRDDLNSIQKELYKIFPLFFQFKDLKYKFFFSLQRLYTEKLKIKPHFTLEYSFKEDL